MKKCNVMIDGKQIVLFFEIMETKYEVSLETHFPRNHVSYNSSCNMLPFADLNFFLPLTSSCCHLAPLKTESERQMVAPEGLLIRRSFIGFKHVVCEHLQDD